MHAVIILQGLFLLVCNPDPTQKSCEIWVPHTRMPGHQEDEHRYTAGFGHSFPPFAEQQDKSKVMTINLAAGKRPAPFNDYNSVPYKQREFKLAGDKIDLVSAKARNRIAIKWPDEIFAFNRVLAPQADIAATLDDKQIVESQPVPSSVNARSYLVAETVVLYYEQGGAFKLSDENGAQVAAAAPARADNDGNVLTWALVISSEPNGCYTQGDHTGDFNSMIKIKSSGANPAFVLTGLKTTTPAGDEAVLDSILPKGAVGSVCLTTPAEAAKATMHAATLRIEDGKYHMFTAKPTGCGTISVMFP